MKPSTNKSSLDAQNYVTEHGKQMKKEFTSIKENTIFSKEKKEALLGALKNSYREEHKSEKHQGALQKKKEDTGLIRKFGEKIKGDKLTKEEFQWAKEQFYGKSESTEKKESKEILTKSLEFEEETFKIDSKGWKEEKRDVYGKGQMKVKVNATGDVVEYLEGPAKGEQIFITYDAFIREVKKAKNCSEEEVEKKYLMTADELKEKMKDKPSGSDEYKKFFNKEVKDHLAGYWNPNHERFNSIGARSHVWLAGGSNANFYQNIWTRDDDYRSYGVSGRLLKN